MAKNKSVKLLTVPNEIHVGDDKTDIIVVTTIQFHDLDIKGKMEYCLHLFVYDVHGEIDPPLILANWDESSVMPIKTSLNRPDDFLGKETVMLKAEQSEITIQTPMALKLGQLRKDSSYLTRKLEIFATAAPALGRVSKWSLPYKTHILR